MLPAPLAYWTDPLIETLRPVMVAKAPLPLPSSDPVTFTAPAEAARVSPPFCQLAERMVMFWPAILSAAPGPQPFRSPLSVTLPAVAWSFIRPACQPMVEFAVMLVPVMVAPALGPAPLSRPFRLTAPLDVTVSAPLAQ